MIIDLETLSSWEKEIILSLALLPCSNYSVPELAGMLQVEEQDQVSFFDTIHDLSAKGFLVRDKGQYGLNPDNKI